MKHNLFFAIVFLLFIKHNAQNSLSKKSVNKPNISFTENKGQVSDQNFKPRPDVIYSGTDGKMVFHIKNNGVSYQLSRVDSWQEDTEKEIKSKSDFKRNEKIADKVTIYRIDADWLNTNKQFTINKDEAIEGFNNYYSELAPNGISKVKSYKGITLKNIYNKIDLHYYQKDACLKYDYLVAARANYKEIEIEIKGASISVEKDGSLLLITPLGIVNEGVPLVYQNDKKLPARWIVNKNILSFEIDNYDSNQALIIDPATRVWGTYVGGTGADAANSCAKDASGNVYFCGNTQSSGGTIIATAGSHQATLSFGTDAFLEKFNAAGIRQWGTYYGGSNSDIALSCATDASGNVYMAGESFSTFTPAISTVGSHQQNISGNSDGFLVKFNSAGVRQWGTYYGGTGGEDVYSCAVDALGNVFMCGTTTSTTNFGTAIATGGSQYPFFLGGGGDAYLVKFNSAGVRQWGTYYGALNSIDYGYACTTDASGNVYLAGSTGPPASLSASYIATPGSYQQTFNGVYDNYLVKFNSAGVRQWGTYYGGSQDESAFSLATNTTGDVFMCGYSKSTTNIANAAGHQTSYGGGPGFGDAFLVKFNSAGARIWGTYYGGSGDEAGSNCIVDGSGNVIMAGQCSSTLTNVIASANCYQTIYGGGTSDAFAVKFSTAGVRQWGTYYGGLGADVGLSLTIDNSALYMAGRSNNSGTVITTSTSHQPLSGGLDDAFLVKFDVCTSSLNATSSSSAICAGNVFTIAATGADTYTWQPGSVVASSIVVSTSVAVNYTLTGAALGCTNTTITFSPIVNSIPVLTVSSGTTCMGQPFNISASGAVTYTYVGGGPVVSPTVSSTYSVTGTDANGCISNPATVSAVTVIAPSISVNSGTICSGQTFTMNPSGAVSYTFSGGNSIVSPTTNTSYTVTGTDAVGCVNFIGAISNLTVGAIPVITVSSGSICEGQSYTMIPGGASNYTFFPAGAVVSPTINSSYTVTGTSALGCVSSSFAVSNVTVNIRPVITSNSGSICSGQSFTIIPSGANTYTFSGGSAVVNPGTTTSFSVTGTNTVGCNSLFPAISNVTVLPSPSMTLATSNNTICVGESATLTANGANTYSWNTGGTSANEVVSPTLTTTYTVNGIGSNGCVTVMNISQNVDACLGILSYSSNSSLNISIYPNPNKGEFTIALNTLSEKIAVEIYNSLGQIISKEKLAGLNNSISISEFACGMYQINVYQNNSLIYKNKIIKE